MPHWMLQVLDPIVTGPGVQSANAVVEKRASPLKTIKERMLQAA
jgi:hypothetical protein